MTDSESARDHALRTRLGTYLDEQCMRLTEYFAAAVRDGDAGAIHKCRVALRRQRSVLRQFRQLVPRRRRRRADRALRALAQTLGPIRDLDALGERLAGDALASLRAGSAGATGAAPAEVLRDAMAAERAVHLAALRPAAAARQLGRVLAHVTQVGAQCEDADPADCLRRVAERFRSEAEVLLPLAQDSEQIEPQHDLRIRIKRFRYACEVLAPLVPGALEEEIRTAQSVQEQLGFAHDLATLAAHARRLVPESPELVEQLDGLRRAEHARLMAGPGLDGGLSALLRARSIPQEVAS